MDAPGSPVTCWYSGPPEMPKFADTGTIIALVGNAGPVVYGDENVVAAEANRQGVDLEPGERIALEGECLDCIWIDAANAGDGVTVVWETVNA